MRPLKHIPSRCRSIEMTTKKAVDHDLIARLWRKFSLAHAVHHNIAIRADTFLYSRFHRL